MVILRGIDIAHGMLHRTTSRYIYSQAPPFVTWRELVGRISHARYKNVQLNAHNFSTKHSMFIGSLPIEKRLERYTQYEFTSDLAQLGKGDRAALKPIVEAAKLIDKIYFRQAWAGNEKLKQKLEELGDEKLLTLFNMYKGPWVSVPSCWFYASLWVNLTNCRLEKTTTYHLWREHLHIPKGQTITLKT